MITQRQMETLSAHFQIDKTIIFREYLQLIFLSYLYKEKESEKIYFKGGTSLRLVYHSPRFSEDLDFSADLPKEKIEKLTEIVIKKMEKEISGLTLNFLYSGSKSIRYKIKYQGREFKYPLTIRIDFSFEKTALKAQAVKIKSRFPINLLPLILTLSEQEVLAEKMRAFLMRGKGRDVFDLWYIFSEGIYLEENLLSEKLKQVGLKFQGNSFLKKIENFSQKRLEKDLGQFLPRHYRRIIPDLKKETIAQLPASWRAS